MGDKEITSCLWNGPAGWIEIKLVHGPDLAGPADLGFTPVMPIHTHVHGQTAIRGAQPGAGSQVMWVEHTDLGIWVGVSPALNDQLMRIAEGIRTPS
jgi:hypothetical protein